LSDTARSILTGTAGLDIAAIVAMLLTVRRAPGVRPPNFRVLGWTTLGIQSLHFVEEWLTGFGARFPLLLGLNPWPEAFFVSFNLIWLVVWVVALLTVGRFRGALFPLWFLAIAAIANGLAHPLAALGTRGYFPGLVTAPLLGVTGVLLFARLFAYTDDKRG
jgi:hypothetical protein